MSERVRRLAERHAEFSVRRDAAGRIVAVPVAQYEELVGTFGDTAKRPSDAPRAEATVQSRGESSSETRRGQESTLDEARLLAARVSAERAALQLAREKGELIRRDGIEAALEEAGVAIGGVIDRLPRQAEDLAAALSQDGIQGLRVALKKIARGLREDIADHLGGLASAAPAEESAEADEEEAA